MHELNLTTEEKNLFLREHKKENPESTMTVDQVGESFVYDVAEHRARKFFVDLLLTEYKAGK